MNSISIKVTFSDQSLYENFIQPRKINNELPSLVLRLLTAYANSEDIAIAVDQFLDREENPHIYSARDAILRALSGLSEVDSALDSEMASLDPQGFAETVLGDNQDGFADLEPIVEGASGGIDPIRGGIEPIRGGIEPAFSPEGVTRYNPLEVNIGSTGSNNDSPVLESINALTQQVSSLADTVSKLVTLGIQPAGESVITADSVGTEPISGIGTVKTVITEPEPVIIEPEPVITEPEPVVPTPTIQPAIPDTPIVVEQESGTTADTDDYEVPDFMRSMLASLD